jgi:hypothetical protein
MDDDVRALPRGSLYGALLFMARHGSSVVLNYGEDTEQWECSWIVNGRRFVGIEADPEAALCAAYYPGWAALAPRSDQ